MNEAKLQRKVRKTLRQRFGGKWWKNSGGPFSERGISDISGITMGVFFAIETKSPESDKEPTPEQYDFLQDIREAGGVAFWSNNHDDIIRRVESALKKREKI